jgi:hypothetical protein
VGEEAPDSKTAPEGAAVYRNIRASHARLVRVLLASKRRLITLARYTLAK